MGNAPILHLSLGTFTRRLTLWVWSPGRMFYPPRFCWEDIHVTCARPTTQAGDYPQRRMDMLEFVAVCETALSVAMGLPTIALTVCSVVAATMAFVVLLNWA